VNQSKKKIRYTWSELW